MSPATPVGHVRMRVPVIMPVQKEFRKGQDLGEGAEH